MSGRVFVVIPVHDRSAMTLSCLASLRCQTHADTVPVVVDGGSTDGTADAVRASFPDAVVLPGDDSMWWTAATHRGVCWALEQADPQDYVLTLNNDTTVRPDYVETLVRIARGEPRALIGSVAVDAREGQTVVDGGAVLDWRTARIRFQNAGQSLAECIARGVTRVSANVLPGRGTLIPVSCFHEIGSFDVASLPHYGADYEFSARAARAGYRLLVSYEAPVFSEVEATGVTALRGRLPWRTFFGMYFSRRSPACLLYRWRFARLSAPRGARLTFAVLDTVRVIGGSVRDQLRGAR